MQLNKASKKTRKIAEETTAAAPETGTPEAAAKLRATKPSTPKKNETNETMSAKHHRKTSSSVTAETSDDKAQAPKTMAGSAGASSASSGFATSREVSHTEIAKLAHSYWIARGYAHGSAEEDWLRAERELKSKL